MITSWTWIDPIIVLYLSIKCLFRYRGHTIWFHHSFLFRQDEIQMSKHRIWVYRLARTPFDAVTTKSDICLRMNLSHSSGINTWLVSCQKCTQWERYAFTDHRTCYSHANCWISSRPTVCFSNKLNHLPDKFSQTFHQLWPKGCYYPAEIKKNGPNVYCPAKVEARIFQGMFSNVNRQILQRLKKKKEPASRKIVK